MYVLAFFAGIASCVGPCLAPRFVALAGLTARGRAPLVTSGVFVAGVITVYATAGCVLGFIGMVVDVSTFVYGALAVALAIGALWTVLRATPQACAHDHTGPPASYGAIFVLGASTSLVFSPCCTPLMVSVASVALALSRPMQGAAILAAFGLGHALPLLALGGVAGRLGHWFSVRRLQQFATVGSASVMLFLAVYFGLLV